MRKLVLGGIAALAFYEFIALLTRVRSRQVNIHEEARVMRLGRIVAEDANECGFDS